MPATMKNIIALAIIFSISLVDAVPYSKYGRTCNDIGCPSNEVCVIAEDPCTYSNSQCGRYPTCKKLDSGSPTCSTMNCPTGQKCRMDSGRPVCVKAQALPTGRRPGYYRPTAVVTRPTVPTPPPRSSSWTPRNPGNPGNSIGGKQSGSWWSRYFGGNSRQTTTTTRRPQFIPNGNFYSGGRNNYNTHVSTDSKGNKTWKFSRNRRSSETDLDHSEMTPWEIDKNIENEILDDNSINDYNDLRNGGIADFYGHFAKEIPPETQTLSRMKRNADSDSGYPEMPKSEDRDKNSKSGNSDSSRPASGQSGYPGGNGYPGGSGYSGFGYPDSPSSSISTTKKPSFSYPNYPSNSRSGYPAGSGYPSGSNSPSSRGYPGESGYPEESYRKTGASTVNAENPGSSSNRGNQGSSSQGSSSQGSSSGGYPTGGGYPGSSNKEYPGSSSRGYPGSSGSGYLNNPYSNPAQNQYNGNQNQYSQYPNQNSNPYQNPNQNRNPYQNPNQNSNPYQNPSQNGYPYQNPSQNGYPYQNPNQNGYPYQIPNQNGYPYQNPSQNGYQYQNNYLNRNSPPNQNYNPQGYPTTEKPSIGKQIQEYATNLLKKVALQKVIETVGSRI